ncbi:MAG TPA: polysaccharide deacetylase family protein [Pedococcus sp.]|nr:polysaccharide deacetylase family protein [Pedococcus sp.]
MHNAPSREADPRGREWELSRRAALGVGCGLMLAACTQTTPHSSAPVGGQATAVAPLATPGLTGAPPPLVSPGLTGARAAVTLSAVEARYGSVQPTRWGLEVPGVVTRLNTGDQKVAALTFDACGGRGGSGYDSALVALLRQHGIKATLFLNHRWILANPTVARELAQDPLFDLANHGTRHLPLSVRGRSAYGITGTRSVREVYDEVETNASFMADLLGRPVRLFRCGTAYYDDVAASVVRDLGMYPVGFTVNGDAGATFSARQVSTAMQAVRPGAIVIGHMNHPLHATAAGMGTALPALVASGYEFVHLADHIS